MSISKNCGKDGFSNIFFYFLTLRQLMDTTDDEKHRTIRSDTSVRKFLFADSVKSIRWFWYHWAKVSIQATFVSCASENVKPSLWKCMKVFDGDTFSTLLSRRIHFFHFSLSANLWWKRIIFFGMKRATLWAGTAVTMTNWKFWQIFEFFLHIPTFFFRFSLLSYQLLSLFQHRVEHQNRRPQKNNAGRPFSSFLISACIKER